MTIPAAKASGRMPVPVHVRLKPGWRCDPRRFAFESAQGERFAARGTLPRGSRVLLTAPQPAGADPAKLHEAERELARDLQVVLPAGAAPQDHLDAIRAWPCVESAQPGPVLSLPR